MAQTAVKQRLNYIDDAKALAILLMIIGHSATYKPVDVLIYGFHIPLFFIVSGLFFNPNRSLSENISKGIKQLIVPYFCFEIINLLICWISPYLHPELYNGISGWGILKAALLGILIAQDRVTSVSFLPYGPLWFLVALFWVKVMMSVMGKLFKNRYLLFCVSSALGIVMYFMLSKEFIHIKTFGVSIFSFKSACMGLPFYAVGYLLKGFDFSKIKFRPLITLLLLTIYVISAFYNGICGIDERNYGRYMVLFYLNAVIGTIAVILFFSQVKMPEYVHDVGRNTLLILGLSGFPILAYKVIEMYVFGQSLISHFYVYVPLSILSIVVIMPLRGFFNKYLPFVLGK